MESGSSWVSKSMKVSAMSDQMSKQAAAAVGVTPKRNTAAMVSAPVRSSTVGYRAEIGAAQAEQRPRRNRKLKTGMFSDAVMGWPQAGHCERGVIRLYEGSSGGGPPDSSAHCARQPRSSIFGSRWMTTFKKLPMHRPTMPLTSHAASGSVNVAGMRLKRARRQTTAPSLKIGRYIATTRPPITTPRNTMMIGSSRLVNAVTASSTSRS